MTNINISTFATRRALIDGHRKGVVSGDRQLSFSEFGALVERVVVMLQHRKIGAGDRVAILSRNGIEFCALYYAVAWLGAVLCPINWRLAPPEVAYILQDSGARVLIHEEDFLETAEHVRRQNLIDQSIVLGSDWEAALDDVKFGEVGPIAAGGEAPLLLVYTSGTTGRPKGAVLTHNQMFWVSTTMATTLDYRWADVSLVPVPMFHVGGMSFATAFTHFGTTAVLLPAWEPGPVLDLIQREKVNHFFAVAAMLNGLLEKLESGAEPLASVRWIMAGGAPVPPALIGEFDRLGIPIIQTYGSTETAGPATVVDLDHALSKAGSAGLPFFHTDINIIAENGAAADIDEVGEVMIRGPHLIREYWRNPTATSEAFTDGWFRSGDLGHRDRDGYLYIVDRRKDMVVSGGENIYPAEVEAALQGCPGLNEVAVVGLPDEKWGEVTCAVVVAEKDVSPSLEAIQSHCKGKIASYKIPKQIIEWKVPLPRNATGKLQKHILKAEIEKGVGR